MAALFVVYEVYFTNPGEMVREYLAQVETFVIIVFLLWRVETLQELIQKDSPADSSLQESAHQQNNAHDQDSELTSNIAMLLKKHCETPQLYLQHDLTLAQLAAALGTNRTYLGAYFAQAGITYNAYINSLRITHFEHLYRQAIANQRPFTAQQLSHECGFKSYSTFAAAFKQFHGLSFTEWMKNSNS